MYESVTFVIRKEVIKEFDEYVEKMRLSPNEILETLLATYLAKAKEFQRHIDEKGFKCTECHELIKNCTCES